MIMMRQSQRHYPLAEYFLIEQMSTVRHEYFDGEIFAMAGGSRNHDRIANRVMLLFEAGLGDKPCEPFSGNMRIRTPSGLYTYPDASIVCGPADVVYIQGTETIGNPVVLVEVLSESTVDYDRGQKFELYQSISTLRDYLLIEQTRVEVEHRYVSDGAWASRTVSGLNETVRLTGVELELPLALVYQRVTF
jgi:Uma2 family endonuclease